MHTKKFKHVNHDRYTDGGHQDYYDNGYRDETKEHRREKRLKNVIRSKDLESLLELDEED